MHWWIIATVLAYFVKGVCGMGNTLVFTSVLSFANSNVNISPVELLLGYPANCILVWKERRHIRWKICLPVIALVILGSLPGIFLLKNVDVSAIKIVFGFVILFVGVQMLLAEVGRVQKKTSKWGVAIIGILSGILCGLYGIGALLGAYMHQVTEDSHSFKGNFCMVFFAENTFRIIVYSLMGILTLSSVKNFLMLAPLMLLGLGLGILSTKFMNEKLLKRCIIIMLMISGVALIVNSI